MLTTERLKVASKMLHFDQVREHELYLEAPAYKRPLILTKALLRVIAKTVFFLIRRADTSNYRVDYSSENWILINDHAGHCEAFIDGILRQFSSTKDCCHITINPKVKPNIYALKTSFHPFDFFSLKSFINAIEFTRSQPGWLEYTPIWKPVALLNLIFNVSRVVEAIRFYKEIKLGPSTKLITLCDAHWHQSVLTCELNDRGAQTFTMIHGLPSEWHLICPFTSRYVLTWGTSMSKMALQYCDDLDPSRLIPIGNTKYHGVKNIDRSTVRSIAEIEEIVFISPGYDSFASYGLRGLQKEIISFINLDTPLRKSIRPRPNKAEERFILRLLRRHKKLGDVAVLTQPEFASVVNNKRLFLGSISSAISDVFLMGGFFVGLREEMEANILETMITFSDDNYYSMRGLLQFLNELRDPKRFSEYTALLDKISKHLSEQITNPLNLHLEKSSAFEE